ncbi:MAG: hypothetical protein EA353_00715 [Puniceicoccaceae bacterium]|nr:MAG: hypothetical protein EA353_00715 [Puniceicoccaceae bacterium]
MDYETLSQAQAVCARSRLPEGVSPLCGKTLHLGVFFDGFSRNLEDDLREERTSNVGRLFLAHMDPEHDTDFDSYHAIYISGLGASYDASLGAQVGGTLSRGRSEMAEIPGDVAGRQAVDAVKDNLSGRSWWQRLKRDLSSLRKKPQNGLKVFRDMVVNTAAEVVEPIRDSRWAAHLIKSGVDVRLQGALTDLDMTIEQLRGGPPLRTIKISVFGFDFGATLARAFVHNLLEKAEQRGDDYFYKDARVEVIFAGLFDAVDRTAASMPPLEFFLPTTNSIDDGGLIHPSVKSVLHLVAAHERRFYRRARLLGERRRGWSEELMPGISEDIGGGIAPGEQKPSNELSLVSLHRMYRAAITSGVSIPSLQELEARDPETAELFVFNDRTPSQRSAFALVRHYQRQVGRHSPGHDAFTHHMQFYIRWLANIWHAYQRELAELAGQLRALENSQGGTWPRSGIFGVATESKEIRAARARQRELENDMSWLKEVNSEAENMRNRLQVYGARAAGTQQMLQVWFVLLTEWFEPQSLEPEVAELFAYFVHDQHVLSTAQRSARWLSGENFFSIRGFDRPSGSLPIERRERA